MLYFIRQHWYIITFLSLDKRCFKLCLLVFPECCNFSKFSLKNILIVEIWKNFRSPIIKLRITINILFSVLFPQINLFLSHPFSLSLLLSPSSLYLKIKIKYNIFSKKYFSKWKVIKTTFICIQEKIEEVIPLGDLIIKSNISHLSATDTVMRIKRQATDWEKIFAKDIW